MKYFRKIMAICAAMGWWGAMYPQFTLVQDTYEIVREEPVAQPVEADRTARSNGAELYWELLRADRGQIHIKSRLLMEIQSFAEKFAEAKEKD